MSTHNDLFALLAPLLPSAPKCTVVILWHLIARCIEENTNEIDVSAYDLAAQLNVSRDAVRVTARFLSSPTAGSVLAVRTTPSGTKWVFPVDWFTPQFSLFEGVENFHTQQTNQATRGPHVEELPGHYAHTWGSNQATPPPKNTTGSRLTRLPFHQWRSNQATNSHAWETNQATPTQNQQLGTLVEELPGQVLDRSSRVVSSFVGVLLLRDSIEGVNRLPPPLAENGQELRRWLRGFFEKHHPSHTAPDGPDEIILAKCLAVAPLASLKGVMEALKRRGTRPGDTWAWWVTVFCQRIHKTKDLTAVPAHPAFHEETPRKNPSHETAAAEAAETPEFGRQMLHQVAGNTRKLS